MTARYVYVGKSKSGLHDNPTQYLYERARDESRQRKRNSKMHTSIIVEASACTPIADHMFMLGSDGDRCESGIESDGDRCESGIDGVSRCVAGGDTGSEPGESAIRSSVR